MTKRHTVEIAVLIAGLMAACSPQAVQQGAAVTTPAPSLPTPSPTSFSFPTSSTPTAAATLIDPVTTAAAIRVDSWSLDSKWLAYWVSDEEDTAGFFYPFPPGRLVFLNQEGRRICPEIRLEARDHSDRVIWQQDGTAVVLTGGTAMRGTPCLGDFAPVTSYADPKIDSVDRHLSPGGALKAETIIISSADNVLTLATSILDTATGEIAARAEWRIHERLGQLGLGGEWITEDEFLIYETVDQGPLILRPGEATVQVATDYLRLTAIPNGLSENGVSLRATASGKQGTPYYHLLLYAVGSEGSFPTVKLFHSESGEIEDLAYRHVWGPSFSPDGHWVLLNDPTGAESISGYALWARPVDPVGSRAHLVGAGFPALWSPDWTRVVFTASYFSSLHAFPDGALINAWRTAEYEPYPRVWSPDGRHLALEGYLPGAWKQALYLLEP